MKVELSKKEIKFLVGVLGPMTESQCKENLRKSLSLSEEEKLIIESFIKDGKCPDLFCKLNSINQEKSLHYK